MNIRRLVNSPTGRIIVSIVLGLGLASLFYKVCKDKECIQFSGPVIKKVDGKVFEYDHKCYKYDAVAVTCDTNKKILPFTEGYTQNTEYKQVHPSTQDYQEPTSRAGLKFPPKHT